MDGQTDERTEWQTTQILYSPPPTLFFQSEALSNEGKKRI